MKKNINYVDVFFVLFGGIFGSGLGFLMQLVLSKSLSARDFGIFSSALTILLAVVPAAILGVFQYWLNIFGAKGNKAWVEVNRLKKIVFISSVVIFISLLGYYFIFEDRNLRVFYFFMGFYFISSIFVEFSLTSCQLSGDFKKFAFWQVSPYAIRLIFIFAFIFFAEEFNIEELSYALLLASICLIVFSFFDVKKFNEKDFSLKNNDVDISGYEEIEIFESLKRSIPYCLASIFFVIYSQFGSLYIKNAIGSSYVGSFSIPLLFITGVAILPNLFYQKYLLAKIHYLSSNNKNEMISIYKKSTYLVFIFGMIFSLLIFLLSDFIFDYIYSGKYENASYLMKVMAVIIPFRFLSECSGAFIATKNFMKFKTFSMFFAALLNIILCFILGKYFGIFGVAISLICVEIFIASSYEIICRRYVMK